MDHEVTWEEKGLFLVIEKDFSNEMLAVGQKLAEDPRIKEVQYIIIDLGGVKKFPIDGGVIRQLAEVDSKLYAINPDVKQAIVATELVMKGITNMYQTYFELSNNNKTWITNVFGSLEEAREWIDS